MKEAAVGTCCNFVFNSRKLLPHFGMKQAKQRSSFFCSDFSNASGTPCHWRDLLFANLLKTLLHVHLHHANITGASCLRSIAVMEI